ncbi:histidine--tRNA ligase [Candidatus Woesebacteria bacterium GWC2_33_12]|uniref:Histidine--tRNA ligase n=1 Tax=Candidatus Woesebacteria bacterium GW2011_GWB1_33_22 TaxID=1618566 RepID=A0A0G0C2A0_9BACT|nr:MAG: Histidyl-tRNA synthetase [Candidatus Woesebacteria bacterium GW2011_GWC2_33_12]KKP42537.1 MAG: Histidyl-tRNA synthetase [Candidatus Woesebacteria bacterium GW2011_GWA2_33_20]KKP45280.1 MAG: Histidyl-tRNA synthetase [Candidatus Woesebacteria bacterium GW2011_GWB1_33_22]KKP47108.1 MAG: Histidyl-tRNA synthetase [Microgenomates group bacterium GW2011_GWC1_33_28]KKP50950.1 MAG: Histidyl-tRNA synthetase [Candidatus Woesebacteria bacterium GW2011_GWA1_33_33]OGM07170.1 MAG: histidine--tRNA lig
MSNNLQTLKGFRDFLPSEVYKRNWVKDIMVKTAERWGYEPIETPTLESYFLFKGEVGEDEKMFYKFKDLGDRDVMLRYDQTVPTCRFVANNQNSLVFPFKRYQFQSVFRAENTQRGRYREFTQFDLDIFGVAGPTADAEVIAENIDTYLSIGFKKPVIIFNNRDLMKGVPYEAITAIDKLKKIGPEGVISDMVKKGIANSKAKEYLKFVSQIKPDETIKTIIEYLEKSGFSREFYRFEPTLARSFSYSQGPIWEIVIEDYKVGSVGGGERYDGMMKRLTGLDIPATGIAFGFDRTVEAADELGLIKVNNVNTKVLVTVFSPNLLDESLKTARFLRQNNIKTGIYPDPNVKLDKQLKYADKKQIPYVIIIGQDEVENKVITLKNLQTKEQKKVTIDEVCRLLLV